MEEKWTHNYTISILLKWIQHPREHYNFSNRSYAKVRIVVRIRNPTIFLHRNSNISPAKMEMDPITRSPEIGSEISLVKNYSENNDIDEHTTNKRKMSLSPELDVGSQGPAEKRKKVFHENDIGRSSIHRDDRFIYGNPKESIKQAVPTESYDNSSVLDLSCKGSRVEEEKPKNSESTYQHYPQNNHQYLQDTFPRSNLEIKLVNPPKRPSTTEQLEIAKQQQQQRRTVQQQQKLLQQMRRSLEAGASRSHPPPETLKKSAPREEPPEAPKPDFRSLLTPSFPPHPYFDPNQTKELPDGHPILPLLDPVYFSALYNAHGFLPPSSPSIAAAFIGTLQDALPKLSMMFPPSTSSCSSPFLPQKGNENPN